VAMDSIYDLDANPLATVAAIVHGLGNHQDRQRSQALTHSYAGSDIQLHVRQFAMQPQLQDLQSSAHRTITCLVAPYNQLSCDLGGFKEIFQPGCFSECLKTDDPLALWGHDPKFVLGCKSAGTARFLERPDGLYFEADAPMTQWATDLLTSMRRGDIKSSSAAFFILKPRWEYRDSQKVRVIEQAKLVEGSVVSFAAYDSTSASVAAEKEASAYAALQVAAEQEHLKARLRLLAA
jgi:HK97 family phage prohead protease